METLQSISARVLAKNNFNENFFHKKLMCHWEIRNARKQEIFDEFSVYENFCLEIESEIHLMMDEVDDDIYSELHIARNSNDCDKLEEIRNEAEEKLEIIKEKESEIALKVKEKEKMEKNSKKNFQKLNMMRKSMKFKIHFMSILTRIIWNKLMNSKIT